MTTRRTTRTTSDNDRFRLRGALHLEQRGDDAAPGDLRAYVFDRQGKLIGLGKVDAEGAFEVSVDLDEPADAQLMIAPEGDPQAIRTSHTALAKIAAEEWKRRRGRFILERELRVAREIWRLWWPKQVCVSGHVRKIVRQDDGTRLCPVPFVKVEVFDVDREACFWPFITRRLPELLDRRVFRIPDLIDEPRFPRPFPLPDPPPDLRPIELPDVRPIERPDLRPIERPNRPIAPQVSSAFSRVGEIKQLDETTASRLERLTLTHTLAPWIVLPNCFYSRRLVCTAVTDENGFFNCCFPWWPFHLRRGRLRFDALPDVILRVTQVIDGVETVIYMDPYSSTRWNVCNAHIDLFLDNDEIQCGSGGTQQRPPGSQVFLTRIGDDEVYRIDQGTGLYNEGSLQNVAYGSSLLTYAQFGDALSNPAGGQKYYRLSWRRQGSAAWTPINSGLTDTRVHKATNFSESHNLGPQTVGGQSALYEIRDFNNYLWYNPDLIGTWQTLLAETDTGRFTLRLEVFDDAGNALSSADVDYRDGTVAPPAVLPPMLDRCDLIIRLDNKPPVVDLGIPAVLNDCGVIPAANVPPLNLNISVSQENGRLHSWGLRYTKGVSNTEKDIVLDSGASNTGQPGSVTQTINVADPLGINMLATLSGTCAYALELWAYPHIRNGRHFIYRREVHKAIAIDS
ncbi:MAG: hypothetical protein AAF657_17340 [Acidobacteriota bacterium]